MTQSLVAAIAALYLARGFFIPLLIGILASYALRPVVDWMNRRLRLPNFAGAAIVLLLLTAGLYGIGNALSGQVSTMLEKLPQAAKQLRQHVKVTKGAPPTALENVQQAAKELQAAAAAAMPTTPAPVKPRVIVTTPPEETPAWLRDYLIAQTGLALSIATQAPIVLLLTYFLLASGDHFRRKLVKVVGSTLSEKKDVVRVLEQVSVQVQRYLLSNVIANVAVGVGTWLAFAAIGVEQAGAWGAAAGILHFIPYLGPVMLAFASGVVALLQFGSPLSAVGVAVTSLLVAGAIGLGFMTWLQSRFANVNATVLFIALLFFGWLWGVWGLLLGAPLVAIGKVLCDHIEELQPVGELLGT